MVFGRSLSKESKWDSKEDQTEHYSRNDDLIVKKNREPPKKNLRKNIGKTLSKKGLGSNIKMFVKIKINARKKLLKIKNEDHYIL